MSDPVRVPATSGFAHSMPFGAELRSDGVRFRLWAPSADRVDLLLQTGGGAEERLPLEKDKDGWFQLVTDRAGAGSAYRFALPDGPTVPDPASRHQSHDVHGPSVVIDPRAYRWQVPDFGGRPWEETVLYEMHVGTFTPAGTWRAAIDRLEHLAMLGVTAVELLPLSDFPGTRGWGYDGVLPFAPDGAYGTPDDLKMLVDAIHVHGMTAWLDVVYNHFGPEGNYLHAYASSFFTDRHHTPWGAAINYDGKRSRPVRDFVIHNALYWLEEYRFDGLRLDAVHAILDDSDPDILTELAKTVQDRIPDRHVHLVLENDANQARYLERRKSGAPKLYTAQWNDDWHHAAHVLLTDEKGGYYEDFADDTGKRMLRALTEGFVYQGDPSAHRDGEKRGEKSAHLPPQAFVAFLQNHDQVGNRAMGERLTRLTDPQALRTMTSLLLLGPQIPMLFMGEEFGATTPFYYFCDFHDELADAVREGRRREFAKFPEFADPTTRATIPDPNAEGTFTASKLDWEALTREEHEDWMALHELLLKLRHNAIVPRLAGTRSDGGRCWDGRALTAAWAMGDGARLTLVANLGPGERSGFEVPPGDLLFETEEGLFDALETGKLPSWSALWFLTDSAPGGDGK